MALKSWKKREVWLISHFKDNPNIHAYVVSAIKELKVLKKHYKNKLNSMPINIANNIVVAFLHLAY